MQARLRGRTEGRCRAVLWIHISEAKIKGGGSPAREAFKLISAERSRLRVEQFLEVIKKYPPGFKADVGEVKINGTQAFVTISYRMPSMFDGGYTMTAEVPLTIDKTSNAWKVDFTGETYGMDRNAALEAARKGQSDGRTRKHGKSRRKLMSAKQAGWFREWVKRKKGKAIPSHVTFFHCFGGFSLALIILQVITGVFMLFYYTPEPDKALYSIEQMSNDVTLGWLFRNLHRWTSTLLLATVFSHMVIVFYYKAYQSPRESPGCPGFFSCSWYFCWL